MSAPQRKPDWLRVRLPDGERQEQFSTIKRRFAERNLNTVCEEARCPNIFECWGQGTATIMILGETCTRGCRFCSVNSGHPGGVVDPHEPANTADALSHMDLAYVVLTMVDRDDLSDGGAAHVAQTVQRIKERCPQLLVETLVGDFQGVREDLDVVVKSGRPDVLSHNVEVVPRLQDAIRDARCSWDRSVDVLRWAKDAGARVTKSSLMVGIGEREDETLEALSLLREADVDVVTIGQYLRPTKKHAPVARYVDPEEFLRLERAAKELGFLFVASGPLVRSSYRAAEAFLSGKLRRADEPTMDRYGVKHRLAVVQS